MGIFCHCQSSLLLLLLSFLLLSLLLFSSFDGVHIVYSHFFTSGFFFYHSWAIFNITYHSYYFLQSLLFYFLYLHSYCTLPLTPKVVDTSGVLISDGVTVGNIVEVDGGDGGVLEDSQQLDTHHQPMEVDSLTDHDQVIGESRSACLVFRFHFLLILFDFICFICNIPRLFIYFHDYFTFVFIFLLYSFFLGGRG